MNKILFSFILLFTSVMVKAQCPDLNAAMVNACGASEGNNEFTVFTTAVSAAASTYTLNYGTSSTAPSNNSMSGSDAAPKTGTGSVTGTGCTVVEVTSGATIIPSGSRVLMISANLDQNYDVTAFCNGGTLYVIYVKINAAGGTNSNWTANGTFGNSLGSNTRYLQVTYSGDPACSAANAPVKAYTQGWASNTDGNFVTWSGATATYGNSGCTVVLPVSLVSFNVSYKSGNAAVKWQTVTEANTDHFNVERSFDGVNFAPIARVAAAGISSEIKNYEFTDKNVAVKPAYYRLQIADRDGARGYSHVVRINPSKTGFTLTLYPSPAVSSITSEWNSSIIGKVTVAVRDMSGRTLKTEQITSHTGLNNYLMQIDSFAKGMYLMEIKSEEGTSTATFIKQ